MTGTKNTPLYPDAHVQLTGEDGSPMFIIGRVMGALRTSGVPREKISEFANEAMSGDYDHLLQTCMKWAACS